MRSASHLCDGGRFLEVKEMVDEDVVALMYEFEMERVSIESYKEGTHADLMEMAQTFLDLSTYSFQSTMGVRYDTHCRCGSEQNVCAGLLCCFRLPIL